MEAELLTLSDLYRQDVPAGTMLIPEYSTSNEFYRDGVEVPELFRNDGGRFNVHDHFIIPESRMFCELIPQRNIAVTGGYLPVYSSSQPSLALSRHWQQKLGAKARWRWAAPGRPDTLHIVVYPLEHLPDRLHAVEPNTHYELFSKTFIPQIDVSQAAVQCPDKPSFPCVVKSAYGAASEGTFMVYDADQYSAVLKHIKGCLSDDAVVIVTDMIENIVNNFCCQFYLNKKGEMTWLGVTEQVMDDDGLWQGGCVRMSLQEQLEVLLKPTMTPVAAKLHERGFFGVVGVDVLVDDDEAHWVVDINPRINGSTPLLLISRLMALRGWTYGYFDSCLKVKGSSENLLERVKNTDEGEIVILGVAGDDDDDVLCTCAVYSNSQEECVELIRRYVHSTD